MNVVSETGTGISELCPHTNVKDGPVWVIAAEICKILGGQAGLWGLSVVVRDIR
jgi:hypothetical protein